LVSNRCGCAPDLVRDGINGFIFDPYDVQGMADVMFRVAHGNVDCEAMGRASQEIIADWSPERFADGLAQAVEAALSAQPARPTLLDRALLWALIHR
jgi:glycosyltransferase involved in cell wall biosynthesis